MSQGESGGQDMAASVLVGLGLGYLAQRFFPGIKPWGMAGGLLLGAASGFYQLFSNDARLRKEHEKEKKKP
jgi:F0F1-type ATP synthase assembly protein I